jgi:hypothetical protein
MNAQVKKMMDACPSYMIAEWALPALINGDQIHRAKASNS